MALESLKTSGELSASADRVVRILLDARKLGHGGIGNYLERLIEAFRVSSELELALVVSPEVAADPFLKRKHNIEGLRLIAEEATSYSFKEYYSMPKRLPFAEFDLFHVPHYTLPYKIPIPTVVTIHDAIHVSHPEKFYYPLVAKRLIRSAIRRANLVFADSHSTAWHLRSFLRPTSRHRKKINVIPVMTDRFYSLDQVTSGPAVQIDLPEKYFLVVCSQPKPHKGLDDLLEVARAFYKAGNRENLKILIVGSGSKIIKERLKGRYKDLENNVECRGFVSKHDLRLMYFNARGVIVPSRAEGFGLPVLEARAMGLPVLVRPVPALCELIDEEATVITKDFSLPAFLDALEKMYASFAAKKHVIKPEQLDQYGSECVMPQLISAYRGVVKEFGK